MLRVDRQVRHLPDVVVLALVAVERVEALLDRILVRAGERGVHEVPDVGVARVHRQAVAVLGRAAQGVDVADVDLGIDALAEQVEGQGDEVHVAGALPVAEQAALDAVRAGHDAELGGRDRGAAVVVGVQAQHHAVAVRDVGQEPLDGVGVDVRRVHLDRRREVEHDRPLRRGLDGVHHRAADLDRVLDLGAGVGLRRVLVAHGGARDPVLELAAELGGLDGDGGDAVLVEPEHDASLEHRRRVVEVHDGPRRALDALVGALDQIGAALHEHLDGDVVGDQVLFDELAHEVEVGLRRRREADLDLLVAHLHERLEHLALAHRVHRVDERLVAVSEVDRAPARRLLELDVGPAAVRDRER